MKFHFDLLDKIRYCSELNRVYAKMENKLLEAKLRNPKFDYSEQEEMIENLQKIYIWVSGLFEEKELIEKHSINIERINLELKFRNSELEKRLKIETDLNKF